MNFAKQESLNKKEISDSEGKNPRSVQETDLHLLAGNNNFAR